MATYTTIEQDVPAKGQRTAYSMASRTFKGIYTSSDRTAMPEDHFYDLENVIPVGDANMHVVPNISSALYDFTTDTVFEAVYAQVGTTPYLFCFTTTGKIFAYNVSAQTAAQINSGHSISTACRMTQWMNTYVLFIDSTGYYSWNGTTFSVITGTGVPTAGTDIVTYAGRVWIANGRLVSYTAAYDGTSTTDPTQATAWSATNGSGFLNMTDPTLVGSIVRLYQQNGYLYIFGATCIYALSDIYVPEGASPPTPVYTLTNVQGIIGTDQASSLFPFNTFLMFANRFGAWALQGIQARKLSRDIDGTWQYLSFANSITGGQCVVQHILCAGFLLARSNDPVFGNQTVVGLWFDDKWWFAAFGSITLIAPMILNNVPVLAAFIGNKLYTLFTDTTTSPNTKIMTPLYSMEDPLSAKAVIRAGVELTTFSGGGSVSATLDGTAGSSVFGALEASGAMQFVNNSGATISFVGAGAIVWTIGGYQLYYGDPPGMWSNYVGMTITSSGINYQLHGVYMDYKKSARWVVVNNA